MSEQQALETDDEIIDIDDSDQETDDQLEDVSEDETQQEQDETVEIVLEGEDEPASKPVPKGFLKRIGKLTGKVEAANTEADAAKRRADMLEEENKLLRLKTQQPETLTKPKLDDFEDDAEYEAALDAYNEKKFNDIAEKKAAEILQNNEQNTTQQTTNANLENNLKAHYERAEKLKVDDYEVTEDKAIELLGKDNAKQIMASTDKSDVILYHLGKHPEKAEKLAALIKSNPIKGVLEIGRLEASLKVKPKRSSAPEPETKLESGNGKAANQGSKGATFE